MTFTIRQAKPRAARFSRRPRGGGASSIHQGQIHATRGKNLLNRQVEATENHFGNQADRGGWGSSADFVLGPDHRENDRIVIVQFGNWLTTYSSWSAGFGSLGPAWEWGAAEVAVAIEVAQPPRFDGGGYHPGDSDEPFSDELVEAVAWLCGHINEQLDQHGGAPIPALHLDRWDQRRERPIPRGYIGHDELANGIRLGKTDPGAQWPWKRFIDLVGGDSTELSPPISNYDAGVAAYYNGVQPLPQRDGLNRYELRVEP